MGKHYFFDFAAEGGVTEDKDGTVLADDAQARREALTTLAGIFRDEMGKLRDEGERFDLRCTVRDEDGRTVCTAEVSFRSE